MKMRAPLQPRGGRVDVARLDRDVGAHRGEPLDVQVHGTLADGAAPGQRHARLPEARDQRAEREDRGAHRLHVLVGRERLDHVARVEADVMGRGLGLHAHALEQLHHRAHVVQLRHVADVDGSGGQQRGREDRQRRVLGTGHPHFARKRHAALNR
jgi:hypothetical protein